MGRNEERLTAEAELLNQYFRGYRGSLKRVRSLEEKKQEILEEFKNPLSGMILSSMPHGSGENLGSAKLPLKLEDINEKIAVQCDEALRSLEEMLRIMDLLPKSSIERLIMEHKYISGLSWETISEKEYMSVTTAVKYWRDGLYQLLDKQEVKEALKRFKEKRQ